MEGNDWPKYFITACKDFYGREQYNSEVSLRTITVDRQSGHLVGDIKVAEIGIAEKFFQPTFSAVSCCPFALLRFGAASHTSVGCLVNVMVGSQNEIPQELIGQEPWLREYLNRSVTDLEILHAMLNNSAIANKALFSRLNS